MRFTLSLTAALLTGTAALADDILVRADIAAATVFLSGAEITRQATVSLPAGEHRLLVALPDGVAGDSFAVTGPEGLVFGPPQRLSDQPVAEGALDTPAEAAARDAVTAAEDALLAAEDAVTVADGAIRALEMQLAYLTAVTRGGAEGAVMPADPAQLPQLLATLGAETARVQAELQEARVARRDLAEAVTDRQAALAAAREALAALRPFDTRVEMLVVPVRAEAATEAEIAVSYLSFAAGWEPGYELRLDSGSGALEVARFVTVYAEDGGVWQDVAMTFSTAQPARQREPTVLNPAPARITEPAPPLPAQAIGRLGGDDMVFAEAAPVMVTDQAAVVVEGLSLSWDYATPVSIGPTGTAVLPLDTLDLTAETEARAIPRFDDTAFLVASATNDSGEPILPGPARFYRDGALMGEDWLPMIAAGGEAELGFGPLDHLRLVWINRSLAEGDRGVFVTADTQVHEIAFGVENLSDAVETVRVLYATPFAEQEDLGLELTLAPQPSERDVDDRRGVQGWTLEVAPGATALVEMRVEFDWPEGMVLNWWP